MKYETQMPIAEYQLTELKHAYQIFGISLSASALSIKQTYRKLIKRWHPDLYPGRTPEHAEAIRMTQLINEAYTAIKDAPLRYYIESGALVGGRIREATRPSADESSGMRSETFPKTDRLEFWVRFVCGALFGILVSIQLALQFLDEPKFLAVGVITVRLGFGFAAARYGDKFWYSILQHWWFWS